MLGRIPGKANAAADYLSRIHVNPATKFKLKIDIKVPIKNIDIQILSNTPDNSLNSIQIHVHDDKNLFDVELTALLDVQNRTINAMSEENPLDKLDLNESTSVLNIASEQRNDPDIKEVINWFRAKQKPDTTYEPYDQQKYSKQFGILVLRNQTLYRKYYDHTGKNFTTQLVVPKHLRKKILFRSQHSKLKGLLGIRKTIKEFRRQYYFPRFTEFLITYINSCLSCLQSKSVNQKTATSPLNPVSSNTSFPADLLEVDIVGQLPKSCSYSYIVTAMDVFTKYLIAQAVTSQSAEVVAKTLMQWFVRHSYIPLGILTDKGSAFTSSLIRELAEMLQIQLNHATVKHAKTIGLLERSHGRNTIGTSLLI